MKGKLVTMAVSFLLCVGMVGAGFASWVITSKTTETGEGTIQVDKVVDKRIKIKSVDADGASVYFGAPTVAIDDAWLQSDNLGKEDLISSVTLNLDGTNLLQLFEDDAKTLTFEATIGISGNDKEKYDAAITNEYISAPVNTKIEKTVTLSDSVEDVSVTFDFNFNWGNFFATGEEDSYVYMNPYNYFNTLWKDGSESEGVDSKWETAGDCALEVLTAIEAIGGVTITITIVGTVA